MDNLATELFVTSLTNNWVWVITVSLFLLIAIGLVWILKKRLLNVYTEGSLSKNFFTLSFIWLLIAVLSSTLFSTYMAEKTGSSIFTAHGLSCLFVGSIYQIAAQLRRRVAPFDITSQPLQDLLELLEQYATSAQQGTHSNTPPEDFIKIKNEIEQRRTDDRVIAGEGSRDLVAVIGWAFIALGGLSSLLGIFY